MSYNIRLEQNPGQPIAIVRRRAQRSDISKVIPEACGTVWNSIRAQSIPGAGRHIAVYLDDVINVEVGVELAAPYAGNGELIASTTPAGRVAATTHYGPYQQLSQAHAAIHEWCAANAHTPASPSWEIYGHWLDEWNNDPSKITTDVYYLLK